MASRKKRTEIEWVGGIAPMPGYITGEGEPYRPEGLIWMGADGAVLGSTIGKPGEVMATAAASLRQAMERPMWGPPHEPTRVRVASAELAAALRSGFPKLEIVCAPTPELDSLMALMREKLDEDYEAHQSEPAAPASRPSERGLACGTSCPGAARVVRRRSVILEGRAPRRGSRLPS